MSVMNIASSSFQLGVEVRGHEGITVEPGSASPFAIFFARVPIGGHKRVLVASSRSRACGEHCRRRTGLAYSARMLRRVTAGGMLLLLASAALVACGASDPQPTPSTEAPSESPIVSAEQARDTFEAFYSTVDAQFAAGSASAEALGEHATPDLAERWAGFIQEDLAEGQISRGVLEVTAIDQDHATSDSIRVRLCTDGRNIVTTDSRGLRIPPSGLVAWSAEFEQTNDGLLLAVLEPLQDQSICGL